MNKICLQCGIDITVNKLKSKGGFCWSCYQRQQHLEDLDRPMLSPDYYFNKKLDEYMELE